MYWSLKFPIATVAIRRVLTSWLVLAGKLLTHAVATHYVHTTQAGCTGLSVFAGQCGSVLQVVQCPVGVASILSIVIPQWDELLLLCRS